MDERIVARFWRKVDKSGGPDACWPWMAFRNPAGYGMFGIGRKVQLAHRVSWWLEKGEPAGMFVCHHCDNPPCCNPAHLFLGTSRDNALDAKAKGRLATGDRHGFRLHPEAVPRGDRHGSRTHPESVPRGEQIARAKLTERQVVEIRQATGTCDEIGARYGISNPAVSRIRRRLRWAHVP